MIASLNHYTPFYEYELSLLSHAAHSLTLNLQAITACNPTVWHVDEKLLKALIESI